MSDKKLGAAFITNQAGQLAGVFTDGDLRRLLEQSSDPLGLQVCAVMTKKPKTIDAEQLAAEALRIMEDNEITTLPVVNEGGVPVGALHLHDLVRAGLA